MCLLVMSNACNFLDWRLSSLSVRLDLCVLRYLVWRVSCSGDEYYTARELEGLHNLSV